MSFLKNIVASAFVAAAVCAAPAHAAFISYTIDKNPDVKIIAGAPAQEFVFDMTKAFGYQAGMQFTTGSLFIRLTDDGSNPNHEMPVLYAGTTLLTPAFGDVADGTVDTGGGTSTTYKFLLNSLPMQDLNADGKLSLFISSASGSNGQAGNFYFAEGILTADIAAGVPEPMSIALMGAGLIGVGAVRRRRNTK